jgi:hypothetical protein
MDIRSCKMSGSFYETKRRGMRRAEEATRQTARRAGKAIDEQQRLQDEQMLPEKNEGDAMTQTGLAEQAR